MVHVPAGVHPGELERRLPAVLLRCEAEGIAGRYRHDPQPRWLDWFVEHDVSLTGVSETGRPGAVDVLPDLAMGGAVPNDAGPLIEWIEQVLIVDAVVQRRVTKLLAHPNVEERHLFVRVDESSMDFGPFDVLGFSDYVPDVVPELPADLDGLWLGARWGEPAYWHRPTGWRRASVLGSG